MKSEFFTHNNTNVLLASCGPAPGTAINTVNNPNNIDGTFIPLYTQFIQQSGPNGTPLNYNQGITVQFATLEQKDSLGEVIGECSNVAYGDGTISIDFNFWNSTDPLTQQILFYHELGHCVLDEVHTTNPEPIMNALINNPVNYDTTAMPFMIAQLFQQVGQ